MPGPRDEVLKAFQASLRIEQLAQTGQLPDEEKQLLKRLRQLDVAIRRDLRQLRRVHELLAQLEEEE